MKTILKTKEKNLFLENRVVQKTMHNVRVAGGGPGNSPIEVIDTYGNIRPNTIWGNTYYVDYRNGVDTNNGLTKGNARKTMSSVNTNLVTSNNFDLVVIDPDSTVAETAMITVSKNRVNFVGDTAGRLYGQGAKVSVGVTTAATDIGTLLNTGVRNSYSGMKFINNNTVDEGIYCVVESGEYTVFSDFEIYKSTDLDQTAASELVLNGDSSQFYNGTIGSLAAAQSGTTIRPNVALNNNLAPSGTKQMRECYFHNTRMLKSAGHTTGSFVHATADADVERTLEFHDCKFINAANAAATPAVAISSAASLTVGKILVTGDSYESGCTALATATGVFVTLPTYAAGGGSAIQAT